MNLDVFVGISLSLIIVGIILVILEIFIIPGFGVSGIIGLLMMIGGVFLVADSFAEGVLYLLIILIVAGLLIYIGYKTGRLKKLWRKVALGEKQRTEEGFVAPKTDYIHYLGKTGKALTLLRPAGTAQIEGERVDVVTDGSFIPKDSAIKVIAVEGTRIIVSREENE
nr:MULTISPECIES: NfeD family protein [unclassified Dehalobacter]